MDNIVQQDVQDYSGRGDSDYSGRGSMFIKPVAAPGVAQMNMASLAPNSRPAPMAVVNSGGMAAMAAQAAKKRKDEEQGQGQAAAAPGAPVYASEGFDFDSIFDGEGLTEEFKEKIKVVFEAAVNERVNFIANALAEQANAALAEQVQTVSEGLASKLDDYLNYVIEEWMGENKLALEEGIRMDVAESFLGGLKELFESHYVSIPEGKVDVLESINNSNDALEKELNQTIEENIALRKALVEQQAGLVFMKIAEDLTDTQVEKLASLAEGLQYDSIEQYAEKLSILKDSYFRQVPMNESREVVQSLQESTDQRILQPNDTMGAYLSVISRQAKK